MPAAHVTKRNPKLSHQQLLHVMSHPVRWVILEALTRQKSAQELAEELTMKQANVQYHLKTLVEAGICNELSLPIASHRFVYERKPFRIRLNTSRDGIAAEVEIAPVIHR